MHQRPRWTGATLAVALLALAACTGGGDTSSPSSTTGSGSASPGSSATGSDPEPDWSLGLDSQPTLAVADGDRAYVSSAGGTRFPPQIYLIDVTTGREITHRTATGQPYDLLLAPDGRLWVAGDRHPDQAGGAGVNVHNPESLVVVDHTDLPGPAYSLALVGDEIWVGSDHIVYALDPDTLEVARTLPIAGPAYLLVVEPSGDGIVAVEGNRLELLQPDGTVRGSQQVDADGNIVAAASTTAVFARVPVGADSTIESFDLALAEAGKPTGVDLDSAGGGVIAAASGDVVLVDDRRDEVLCIPDGTPPAASIPTTDLAGVLAELTDGRFLFATTTGIAVRAITC